MEVGAGGTGVDSGAVAQVRRRRAAGKGGRGGRIMRGEGGRTGGRAEIGVGGRKAGMKMDESQGDEEVDQIWGGGQER